MFGRSYNPMMAMLGGQMNTPQPAMNWWQALSQPQYTTSNTPHFYQRPMVNSYMPQPSPYGLMPMLRQPAGFRPTTEALPIVSPLLNNPGDPTGGGANSRRGATDAQLDALSEAREKMKTASSALDKWNWMKKLEDYSAGWRTQDERYNQEAQDARSAYQNALYKAVLAGYNPNAGGAT